MDGELDRLTAQAAPRPRQLSGVGAEIAGALLAAAGDNQASAFGGCLLDAVRWFPDPGVLRQDGAPSPQPGWNRQANAALYRVVVVRLRWHQPTRDSLARRTNEGLSKREIIRCLKRYVAREVFAAFHAPTAPADTT